MNEAPTVAKGSLGVNRIRTFHRRAGLPALREGARHVAEAAGGFLGLTSKISASEQSALDEMARLLAG